MAQEPGKTFFKKSIYWWMVAMKQNHAKCQELNVTLIEHAKQNLIEKDVFTLLECVLRASGVW